MHCWFIKLLTTRFSCFPLNLIFVLQTLTRKLPTSDVSSTSHCSDATCTTCTTCTTSILKVRAAGLYQEGTEGTLAMTGRTLPASEATPVPLGVQLISASAPAVHPHDTQGGEKISAFTSMTSEEGNSRIKIPTGNDASAKASTSTAGVEFPALFTTTTATSVNDGSQALASGVSSPGRCGTIFLLFLSSILYSLSRIIETHQANRPQPIIACFSSSIFTFPAQAGAISWTKRILAWTWKDTIWRPCNQQRKVNYFSLCLYIRFFVMSSMQDVCKK